MINWFLNKIFPLMRSFTLFLVVGGITALIYFGFLVFFLEVLDINYQLGVTIAFIFACSFQFFANRQVTFHSVKKGVIAQVIRYLTWAILSYVITLGIVTFTHDYFNLNTYFGVVIALVFTTNLGFFLSKKWIYKLGKR